MRLDIEALFHRPQIRKDDEEGDDDRDESQSKDYCPVILLQKRKKVGENIQKHSNLLDDGSVSPF